jgi:hypothetical protein
LRPIGSTPRRLHAWPLAPSLWRFWPDLVSSNVAVQVMNAFMLPLVLRFLIALAVKALPGAYRLRGFYLWIVVVVAAVTCALGDFGGLSGVGLV